MRSGEMSKQSRQRGQVSARRDDARAPRPGVAPGRTQPGSEAPVIEAWRRHGTAVILLFTTALLVRLVFLLVSPAAEPEMHLAVLGEIARLCADVEVRGLLLECRQPRDVMLIIRQYRRLHTPFAQARG